ncbi:ACT domain-containing protein [Amycolatopsis orientalis]|uniref:ACT domain-containing protein n=1 Tax=Amycolatopsis orientalis TaxID=31958 RepID=UPI0003A3843D|nr:ACT domain-containing protein [Amycolatopsis orientalis]
MTASEKRSASRKRSVNRELVELAALFFATGIADLFVSTLSNNRVGPVLLFALGGLFVVAATLRHHWSHRTPRSGPPGQGAAIEWRLRATVRDVPGSLAALTATLAAHRYDIASMQVLTAPDGAVDEFLLRAPEGTTGAEIAEAARSGGGENVWVVRADAHDLVDLPTRMLALAAQAAGTASDVAQLLGALLGQSCTVQRKTGGRPRDERVTGTVMLLHGRPGEFLEIRRPLLPFTLAEFARAKALLRVHLAAAAPSACSVPGDSGER